MKKGFLGKIAIVLAVVFIVGGLGFLTNGFKNWNAGTWFKKDDSAPTDTNEVLVVDDTIKSDKVYDMPAKMVFTDISPAAGGTSLAEVTLQATVKPDSLADKTLDWTADWVNPASEWATGKTLNTYVALNVGLNNIVTVQYRAPFGERVKIRATLRQNPEKYAECMVDCASTITSAGIDFYAADPELGGESHYTIQQTASEYLHSAYARAVLAPIPGYEFENTKWLGLSPNYSVHTLQDNFTVKYYLTYSQAYRTALTAQGFALKANAANEIEVKKIEDAVCFANPILNVSLSNLLLFDMLNFEPCEKVLAANNALGANSAGTLKVVATGQYSTFTRSVNLKLDLTVLSNSLDYIRSALASVELSDNTLVF